ncbi:MAG: thioredoxin [Thermoplasmatota archaeon]
MPDETPDPELAALRARILSEWNTGANAAPSPHGPAPAPSNPLLAAAQKGAVIHVTDGTFDSVRSESRQFLVDCWATWCGPCRMVAPVVEAIAKEQAGQLVVGKLDVDANPQTAQRFAVQSIPTLLLFKDGALANRVVGAVPKAMLERAIVQTFGPRRRAGPQAGRREPRDARD